MQLVQRRSVTEWPWVILSSPMVFMRFFPPRKWTLYLSFPEHTLIWMEMEERQVPRWLSGWLPEAVLYHDPEVRWGLE